MIRLILILSLDLVSIGGILTDKYDLVECTKEAKKKNIEMLGYLK